MIPRILPAVLDKVSSSSMLGDSLSPFFCQLSGSNPGTVCLVPLNGENAVVEETVADRKVEASFCQQARSTAGSQNSGPTVGGLIYCAAGSLAPRALLSVGPPGIPGNPRPAPVNVGTRLREVVVSWEVVAGVRTFAGNPLVGVDGD